MSDLAPNLPQELITDILLRLPVESIGRFRCVSKPWKSYLSNSKFIKSHLKFHNPEKVILLAADHSPYILTFTKQSRAQIGGFSRQIICPFLQDKNWAKLEGSCHGLILLVTENRGKFLMNPVTSEVENLPVFDSSLDPLMSFCMHGFGYDEANDDYKVVTLSYYDTDNEYEPDCAETFVDIYSLKSRIWKRLPCSPYDHAVPSISPGIFVSGCLHWLASSRRKGYPSVIAAFDLAKEEFEELPPPIGVDEDKFVFNELAVLGGCLALFIDSYKGHIDVWVMKEYGVRDSWTKIAIDCPEDRRDADSWKPVCFLGDDEIVLVMDCEKLVAHNFRNGGWRDMEFDGVPDSFGEGVMTFKDSLLPPHS
ncbi:OLC1v1020426C1 [Oldenlandia corymbosa var. corymbosa]|uniref:OLC1v1020426C1 n=1 Tax=Oldenlandia corymbosa var. corymbosa TaxID=529605 RepID=A0AAV1EGP7_OLDCO|nr:OLC1v1020426C1 [Oldenlandia corymbosa var. corymbosa]